MDITDVERALLALDVRDRAAVIHRGLRSLENEHADVAQPEIDSAWHDELRRRIEAIESGNVQLPDLDESHTQMRAESAARRG